MANGTAAHALDLDDVPDPAMSHPSERRRSCVSPDGVSIQTGRHQDQPVPTVADIGVGRDGLVALQDGWRRAAPVDGRRFVRQAAARRAMAA